MKKFEKILRKHIEAVRANTSLTTDTGSGAPPNPCHSGGKPDRKKICDAVAEIRKSVGNYSGNNQCAKHIQRNNTDDCKRDNLKFSNVKLACERYRDSVRAALPAGSTANQIAEAERKAMCDCINFVRYGEPKTLSGNTTIDDGLNTYIMANHFSREISAYYGVGCNYLDLGAICDEIEKLNKFAREPGLMCF